MQIEINSSEFFSKPAEFPRDAITRDPRVIARLTPSRRNGSMDARTAEGIFLFDGFRLAPEAGGPFQRDDAGIFVPVALGSRALDLLVLLVTRRGDLVS